MGPRGHVTVYVGGTHRACPPEDTLSRIRPLLPRVGVTRVADITGLDRVGIPVLCAIRPRGQILQTTNGKGLRAVDARVSAIMEALEHWHCEGDPSGNVLLHEERMSCREAHAASGCRAVDPALLPAADRSVIEAAPRVRWVSGQDLLAEEPVLLPASSIHANEIPRQFAFSTNGLASGNTLEEATLHALYEVVERDVVTRRVQGGRLRLDPPSARRIRAGSVDAPGPAELLDLIEGSGLEASLVHLQGPGAVTVFWAALLDAHPFHPCTQVNFGFGAHLSPAVAAVRALSEAAQARLSFIHGVREDLGQRIRAARDSLVRPVFDFFGAIPETLEWGDLDDASSDGLDRDLALLLDAVSSVGYATVLRADLTRADMGIPVVKVLVPGAAHDRRFF